MAWIRVDQSIRDHRKIYDLSDALNISVPLTIGLLICLWLWGMDNTTSGNLDGISARTIARAAKWDGDPEQLLDALIDSGFIDVDDAGRKFIHDWAEYEGKYISARECERERSRSRRNSQRVDNQRSTDGRTAVDQKTADGKEDKTKQDQSIAAGNKADETTTSDPVPYEQIVMLYNNICVDMHEVRTITPKRRAAMGECWAEYGQLFFFDELFRAAQASSFLHGNSDRGWRADFDWLIQPENMKKVLEGKYTNHQRKISTLDALAAIIHDSEGGTP